MQPRQVERQSILPSSKSIGQFFRYCFEKYLDYMSQVPGFPKKYCYPDGNPVHPVLPIVNEPKEIMIVGAFPSARFQARNGKLIPVTDNLSPFAREKYFDGRALRTQASRDILDAHYFPVLGLDPDELWLTDLVKVYLFPDDHIANCRAINRAFECTNTRKLFQPLAKASLPWLVQEIVLCKPKVIITLGEVTAKVLSNDYATNNVELLTGTLRPISIGRHEMHIAHLGHPESWRRNVNDWRERTNNAIRRLAQQLGNNAQTISHLH